MPEATIVPVGVVLILREEFAEIAQTGKAPFLSSHALRIRAERLVQLLDGSLSRLS